MCPFCTIPCNQPWCPYTERENEMVTIFNLNGKSYSYDNGNAEETKKAWCDAFNIISERYEEIEKESEEIIRNFDKRFPLLANKNKNNNCEYYIDFADFE